MKNIRLKIVFVLFGFIGLVNGVVGQQYSEVGLLIRFDDGTPQDTIDKIRTEFNCVELWKSPITDTYNWKVNYFPFIIPNTTDTIGNIEDAIARAKGRQGSNDFDISYDYNFISPIVPPGPPPAYIPAVPLCYNKNTEVNENQKTIKICIMDTGYDPLYSLINVSSGYNYVDNNYNLIDDNGHGTKVLNIIESTINENFPDNNVQYDLRKTHNQLGLGLMSNILLATEEAILDGSNIINMSFSYLDLVSNFEKNILKKTIEAAEENEVLIVCSSGNEGIDIGITNQSSYPSTFQDENIISVASFNCLTNDLSIFSNFSKLSVDISAPGENIEFTYDQSTNPVIGSGTSFAAPYISGIAAGLGQLQDVFNYEEVKCAILEGGDFYPALFGKIVSSKLLNAENAYEIILEGCNNRRGNSSRFRKDQQMLVYPNPSNGTINFSREINKYVIYNVSGQEIYRYNNPENTMQSFNFINLSTGLYVIKTFEEAKISTHKFIVN